MEEIPETFLRLIWSGTRFLLWQLFFNIVLFKIGQFFLLLVTLGRYPRASDLDKDCVKIAWIGFGVLVNAWLVIAIYNNQH